MCFCSRIRKCHTLLSPTCSLLEPHSLGCLTGASLSRHDWLSNYPLAHWLTLQAVFPPWRSQGQDISVNPVITWLDPLSNSPCLGALRCALQGGSLGTDKLACYEPLIIQKTQGFLKLYARAQDKESCKIVVMLLSSQMGCELRAPSPV